MTGATRRARRPAGWAIALAAVAVAWTPQPLAGQIAKRSLTVEELQVIDLGPSKLPVPGPNPGISEPNCPWAGGFHIPGTNNTIFAFTVFDDGNGAALYAAGDFTVAGAAPATRVAKWNGATWSSLGSGMNGTVNALVGFDDGEGPALYAGGNFTTAGGVLVNRVAKWDGSAWSALGDETFFGTSHRVWALEVFDDGGGPKLYAAGEFLTAGGNSAFRIARWDGTTWSELDSGFNGDVRTLTVFDDGSGEALYAGGFFTTASGGAASRVAKWNGTSWSPLGAGTSGTVFALAAYDDGTGLALYAGGAFLNAGGVPVNRIAKWDGSNWSAIGTGMETTVNALAVYDDGGGPALYAGGIFTTADGVTVNRIAKWDGLEWFDLNGGMDGAVNALVVFDDGTESALYAGGAFFHAGGVPVNRIAKWTGVQWATEGPGNGVSNSTTINALATFDDGSGDALFAGGAFVAAGGIVANRIARWDGATWSSLGSGMNNTVYALATFDDGMGPALYAGGAFTSAGGVAADRIAKWNGSAWSPLGSGLNGDVRALAVYDDCFGPALYAGGSFTLAGEVSAVRIAKWDGANWSALDGGISGTAPAVRALAVYDDGFGDALFAGGNFNTAGSVPAVGIARWDGFGWTAVGAGVGGVFPSVFALAVFSDGRGPVLFAGGQFTTAGGNTANRIARWDGSNWSALGSGVSATVNALTVYDDTAGPGLYVGGSFTAAGGASANRIARWDGAVWSALNSGVSSAVNALSSYDDGTDPALYVGGTFVTAGGTPSAGLAQWACEIGPCEDDGVCWDGDHCTADTCEDSACVHTPIDVLIDVEIVLEGVLEEVTRCIHFVADDCDVSADHLLSFVDHDSNGETPVRFVGTIDMPCGNWTKLCAKDQQHSMWDTAELLTTNGLDYVASAPLVLRGGDTDNDGDVDINDVTRFMNQFGMAAEPGGCPWDGTRDADFSNDGVVNAEDYTFLTTNLLTATTCACTPDACSQVVAFRGSPDQVEHVLDLADGQSEYAPPADFNGDGIVDFQDVRMFEALHGLPPALSAALERMETAHSPAVAAPTPGVRETLNEHKDRERDTDTEYKRIDHGPIGAR